MILTLEHKCVDGCDVLGQNAALINTFLLQSKPNHTISHSWSHEQYI